MGLDSPGFTTIRHLLASMAAGGVMQNLTQIQLQRYGQNQALMMGSFQLDSVIGDPQSLGWGRGESLGGGSWTGCETLLHCCK